MLSRSGGRGHIVAIATKVAIKEPSVGGSIQNNDLQTKSMYTMQLKEFIGK